MVDIFMGYLCYTGMWQSGAIHMLHGSITKFRIFPSKKEMYCNFLVKCRKYLVFYLEKCRKVGAFALEKCKFMLKTHCFHPFLTSMMQSLQLKESLR